MASSPFAFLNTKNTGRGGFTNASRKLPATPAENLVVIVDRSQVVKVLIPFNTNRAPAIRQFCQVPTPATSARRARTSGAGSSIDPITIAEYRRPSAAVPARRTANGCGSGPGYRLSARSRCTA